MFLGAVIALALQAVPATDIQTQKPADVADQAAQSAGEQEGKVGPAFPADQVGHPGHETQPTRDQASPQASDDQAAKKRPEAKADCAVAATTCEDACKDAKAGEELSCKARCKRDELACSTNSKHVHDTDLQPQKGQKSQKAQGRHTTNKYRATP